MCEAGTMPRSAINRGRIRECEHAIDVPAGQAAVPTLDGAVGLDELANDDEALGVAHGHAQQSTAQRFVIHRQRHTVRQKSEFGPPDGQGLQQSDLSLALVIAEVPALDKYYRLR